MDERIKEKVSTKKYGAFAPIFQELLDRAMKEYDLPIEYVDKFVSSCNKIKVGKMPDDFDPDLYYGVAQYSEKRIIINSRFKKGVQEDPEAYNKLLATINHEMFHFLNDVRFTLKMNNMWNEVFTEVASSRTTFGKNKEDLFKYRTATDGYKEATFGLNILAAAMGISEKELIKESFNLELSKKFEDVNTQFFINETGSCLDQIINASYFQGASTEEKRKLRTQAYRNIYYLRKKIVK